MARFTLLDDHELEGLRRKTKRETKEDVIRDALAVYAYLISKVKDGSKVYSGSDPDRLTELRITALEGLRKS